METIKSNNVINSAWNKPTNPMDGYQYLNPVTKRLEIYLNHQWTPIYTIVVNSTKYTVYGGQSWSYTVDPLSDVTVIIEDEEITDSVYNIETGEIIIDSVNNDIIITINESIDDNVSDVVEEE